MHGRNTGGASRCGHFNLSIQCALLRDIRDRYDDILVYGILPSLIDEHSGAILAVEVDKKQANGSCSLRSTMKVISNLLSGTTSEHTNVSSSAFFVVAIRQHD